MSWPFLCLVGTTGFEPVTTTPPVWCATKLRYAPKGVDSTLCGWLDKVFSWLTILRNNTCRHI